MTPEEHQHLGLLAAELRQKQTSADLELRSLGTTVSPRRHAELTALRQANEVELRKLEAFVTEPFPPSPSTDTPSAPGYAVPWVRPAPLPQAARVNVPPTPQQRPSLAPRRAVTPADFPRAPNAQALTMARPGALVGADVRKDSPSGFADTGSGLLALGPQSDAPVASHPLFNRPVARPRRAPLGSITQPHGHPMTGPPSPQLAAKLARIREAKKARGR